MERIGRLRAHPHPPIQTVCEAVKSATARERGGGHVGFDEERMWLHHFQSTMLGHQALVGHSVNVVGRTAALVTLALIEMERLERKTGWSPPTAGSPSRLGMCKRSGFVRVKCVQRYGAWQRELIAIKRQGAAGWYFTRLLDDPSFVQN